ncbi:hypothetical protein DRQ09_06010 [candidate division KSB1 bacterium]|nr:MAG: hypothetical protein DRQ09_06010 [candidate division KSB1 bacterium]
MKVKIGSGSIEIVKGDITEQETDAIVNAANNHFWMGAGVAGAIKRKGGDEIEKEAVSKGPVEVGCAVITGAGKLKSKYVIHAAGMGQNLRTDKDKVRKATLSSLELAEKHNLSSISFPSIGTGVGGLSPYQCAPVMLNEAIEFLQIAKNLKKVVFVLFDETNFDAFKKELERIFTFKK